MYQTYSTNMALITHNDTDLNTSINIFEYSVSFKDVPLT